MSAPTKSKLILLDPALMEYGGHHAEFARFLRAELASKFDVSVYSNLMIRAALMTEVEAQAIFPHNFYEEMEDFGPLYQARIEAMAKALRGVDLGDLDPRTIIMLHTATVPQLLGLADWVAGLPVPHRPKVFLQFQYPIEFGINEEANRSRAIYLAREALGQLAATSTIRVASNGRSLAEHISRVLDRRCAVMPLPIRWPDMRHVSPAPLAPVFGFFGGLRREKGAAIMAAAIPRFLAQHPDAQFIVHAGASGTDVQAVRVLERFPQVQVIRAIFPDKAAYFAHFLRAGCILLPYDPAAYAIRTSGVLFEALGLGRMIITTRGTWLEGELAGRRKQAFLMPRFHPDDLVQCLEQAWLELLGRSQDADFDASVISECSAASFCEVLVELMQS